MCYIKLLVAFVFGIAETGSKLCPENEGVKVVPVCTSGTVQGGAVAISTEDLPSLPELNCSCTINAYVVGDEPVPVLYYYGPGYSPCGIEFDVGGYKFSCFQGYINFGQAVQEIRFTKTLPSSYPEACLLFLSGGPNTEIRISCRKPNMANTPMTTNSSTTKPVSAKTARLASETSTRSSSSFVSDVSRGENRITTNLTTVVTDVINLSTLPNVSYISKTSSKTTLLQSDTTDTSVSTKASSEQSSLTTDVPSTKLPKTFKTRSMPTSHLSVTTVRQNSNPRETNGTAGLSSTNHFSSRSSTGRSVFPTSADSTDNNPGSTTISVLLGKAHDEADRTYIIVIAVCCGVLIALLIAVFAFLYNLRHRTRSRNKLIPKREHTATTYTCIDAFRGDTITLLNEPVYFTATPAETDRHHDQRLETSPVALDISAAPFSDTIVTPTQTDIYAVVTKRPPVFLTQPVKKMVSFQGAGAGSGQGKHSPSEGQRKPVSQFGILQRRESAKLERKISQIQRDIIGNRDARSQYDHIDVDMHTF